MPITSRGQRAIITMRAFFGDEAPIVYRFHANNVQRVPLTVAAGTSVTHTFGGPPSATYAIFFAICSNVEGVTWQRSNNGTVVAAEPAKELRPFFVSDSFGTNIWGNDGAFTTPQVKITNGTAYDAKVEILYARTK